MRLQTSTPLAVIIIVGSVRDTKAIQDRRITYQSTNDFIFEVDEQENILYNPSFSRIVKRIDLQPLYKTVNVLSSLISRYNETCYETGRHSTNSSLHNNFQRIPGVRMTVFKGLKTCRSL